MYSINIHPLWLVTMGFGLGFFMGASTALLLAIKDIRHERNDKKKSG